MGGHFYQGVWRADLIMQGKSCRREFKDFESACAHRKKLEKISGMFND